MVGDSSWIVFTQNPKMMDVDPEVEAIKDNQTTVFSLGKANYGLEFSGLIFRRHLLTIRRRIARPSPCFWNLYPY